MILCAWSVVFVENVPLLVTWMEIVSVELEKEILISIWSHQFGVLITTCTYSYVVTVFFCFLWHGLRFFC